MSFCEFVEHIMEFLVNLLLIRGRYLTKSATQTLHLAIKKWLQLQKQVQSGYRQTKNIMTPFENMMDVMNYNANEYMAEGAALVMTNSGPYQHLQTGKQDIDLTAYTYTYTIPKLLEESNIKLEQLCGQVKSAIPHSCGGNPDSPTTKALTHDHVVANLQAILKAQEFLFKTIITLMDSLEKDAGLNTHSFQMENIKNKLGACSEILSNSSGCDNFANFINEVIEEEITRCRFRHGEAKTSAEISLRDWQPIGMENALEKAVEEKEKVSEGEEPKKQGAVAEEEHRVVSLTTSTPASDVESDLHKYYGKLIEALQDQQKAKELIEANQQHFGKFEDMLWHSLTAMKYKSLEDEYEDMRRRTEANKEQFLAFESQVSNKRTDSDDKDKFWEMSDTMQQVLQQNRSEASRCLEGDLAGVDKEVPIRLDERVTEKKTSLDKETSDDKTPVSLVSPAPGGEQVVEKKTISDIIMTQDLSEILVPTEESSTVELPTRNERETVKFEENVQAVQKEKDVEEIVFETPLKHEFQDNISDRSEQISVQADKRLEESDEDEFKDYIWPTIKEDVCELKDTGDYKFKDYIYPTIKESVLEEDATTPINENITNQSKQANPILEENKGALDAVHEVSVITTPKTTIAESSASVPPEAVPFLKAKLQRNIPFGLTENRDFKDSKGEKKEKNILVKAMVEKFQDSSPIQKEQNSATNPLSLKENSAPKLQRNIPFGSKENRDLEGHREENILIRALASLGITTSRVHKIQGSIPDAKQEERIPEPKQELSVPSTPPPPIKESTIERDLKDSQSNKKEENILIEASQSNKKEENIFIGAITGPVITESKADNLHENSVGLKEVSVTSPPDPTIKETTIKKSEENVSVLSKALSYLTDSSEAKLQRNISSQSRENRDFKENAGVKKEEHVLVKAIADLVVKDGKVDKAHEGITILKDIVSVTPKPDPPIEESAAKLRRNIPYRSTENRDLKDNKGDKKEENKLVGTITSPLNKDNKIKKSQDDIPGLRDVPVPPTPNPSIIKEPKEAKFEENILVTSKVHPFPIDASKAKLQRNVSSRSREDRDFIDRKFDKMEEGMGSSVIKDSKVDNKEEETARSVIKDGKADKVQEGPSNLKEVSTTSAPKPVVKEPNLNKFQENISVTSKESNPANVEKGIPRETHDLKDSQGDKKEENILIGAVASPVIKGNEVDEFQKEIPHVRGILVTPTLYQAITQELKMKNFHENMAIQAVASPVIEDNKVGKFRKEVPHLRGILVTPTLYQTTVQEPKITKYQENMSASSKESSDAKLDRNISSRSRENRGLKDYRNDRKEENILKGPIASPVPNLKAISATSTPNPTITQEPKMEVLENISLTIKEGTDANLQRNISRSQEKRVLKDSKNDKKEENILKGAITSPIPNLKAISATSTPNTTITQEPKMEVLENISLTIKEGTDANLQRNIPRSKEKRVLKDSKNDKKDENLLIGATTGPVSKGSKVDKLQEDVSSLKEISVTPTPNASIIKEPKMIKIQGNTSVPSNVQPFLNESATARLQRNISFRSRENRNNNDSRGRKKDENVIVRAAASPIIKDSKVDRSQAIISGLKQEISVTSTPNLLIKGSRKNEIQENSSITPKETSAAKLQRNISIQSRENRNPVITEEPKMIKFQETSVTRPSSNRSNGPKLQRNSLLRSEENRDLKKSKGEKKEENLVIKDDKVDKVHGGIPVVKDSKDAKTDERELLGPVIEDSKVDKIQEHIPNLTEKVSITPTPNPTIEERSISVTSKEHPFLDESSLAKMQRNISFRSKENRGLEDGKGDKKEENILMGTMASQVFKGNKVEKFQEDPKEDIFITASSNLPIEKITKNEFQENMSDTPKESSASKLGRNISFGSKENRDLQDGKGAKKEEIPLVKAMENEVQKGIPDLKEEISVTSTSILSDTTEFQEKDSGTSQAPPDFEKSSEETWQSIKGGIVDKVQETIPGMKKEISIERKMQEFQETNSITSEAFPSLSEISTSKLQRNITFGSKENRELDEKKDIEVDAFDGTATLQEVSTKPITDPFSKNREEHRVLVETYQDQSSVKHDKVYESNPLLKESQLDGFEEVPEITAANPLIRESDLDRPHEKVSITSRKDVILADSQTNSVVKPLHDKLDESQALMASRSIKEKFKEDTYCMTAANPLSTESNSDKGLEQSVANPLLTEDNLEETVATRPIENPPANERKGEDAFKRDKTENVSVKSRMKEHPAFIEIKTERGQENISAKSKVIKKGDSMEKRYHGKTPARLMKTPNLKERKENTLQKETRTPMRKDLIKPRQNFFVKDRHENVDIDKYPEKDSSESTPRLLVGSAKEVDRLKPDRETEAFQTERIVKNAHTPEDKMEVSEDLSPKITPSSTSQSFTFFVLPKSSENSVKNTKQKALECNRNYPQNRCLPSPRPKVSDFKNTSKGKITKHSGTGIRSTPRQLEFALKRQSADSKKMSWSSTNELENEVVKESPISPKNMKEEADRINVNKKAFFELETTLGSAHLLKKPLRTIKKTKSSMRTNEKKTFKIDDHRRNKCTDQGSTESSQTEDSQSTNPKTRKGTTITQTEKCKTFLKISSHKPKTRHYTQGAVKVSRSNNILSRDRSPLPFRTTKAAIKKQMFVCASSKKALKGPLEMAEAAAANEEIDIVNHCEFKLSEFDSDRKGTKSSRLCGTKS